MTSKISRRDFLKLSGATLAGLAFAPYQPPINTLDDGNQIRISTTQVSV